MFPASLCWPFRGRGRLGRSVVSSASVLSASVLSAWVCACSPGVGGSLTPAGYRHSTYGYALSSDPATGSLLPAAWKLDGASVEGGRVKPQTGDEYAATIYFDVNGDGTADTGDRQPFFDLRYVHESGAGTLWVSTLPMPRALAAEPLDSVVARYLAATQKTGPQAVNLGLGGPEGPAPASVTMELSAQGTLAGREARGLKLAISSAPAHGGEPAARQVVLTLCRPGFSRVVKAPGRKATRFPVLLVVGLEARPDALDALLADYDSLASRLSIDDQMGAQLTWVDTSGSVVADAGNGPSAGELERARALADAFLEAESLSFEVVGESAGLDFDREAASVALAHATEQARSCRTESKNATGLRGQGVIEVVYAPSGYVRSATLEGEGKRFQGTDVGKCVVGSFKLAAVPVFEGQSARVVKRFAVE